MATTQFMADASATYGTEFFTSTAGTVTIDSTVTRNGNPRSIKFNTSNPAVSANVIKNSIMADAGTRSSWWVYFPSVSPAAIGQICTVANGSDISVVNVSLNTNGTLRLTVASVAPVDGTTVLLPNVWYRIGLSYIITGSITYNFKLYINGIQECSIVNSTAIGATGSARISLAVNSALGTNFVSYVAELYIDNGSNAADVGNIAITAKLPNSNNTNNFNTAIGANPANRWTNVNARPISTANGWEENVASSVQENYGLETAGIGDRNILGATLLSRCAWLWAAGTVGGGTHSIMNNGTETNITVTNTPALYTNIVDSTSYPSNAAGIGMRSSGTTDFALLYGCGMLLAYTEVPAQSTFQGSQRFDAPIDLNGQWWQPQNKVPISGQAVASFLSYQRSQRFDPLTEQNYTWWNTYRQKYLATLIPGAVSTPPPSGQSSQRWDTPIDLNGQWWEQFYKQPIVIIVTPPPSGQSSQRWDTPIDLNLLWWEQSRRWPVPVTPVPMPPPNKQPSQRWDAIPDLNGQWWEQFRKSPLPSYFVISQEGVFGIYSTIGSLTGIGQSGLFRVQNNIEGWNVYVGVDALPDLTQPPTAFSLTLPISIVVTPPGSGTRTFYVLVRKQDAYGLESQNSHYSTITINSAGVFLPASIPVPQGLSAYQADIGTIKVLASYPTALLDVNPADLWKVWVKATLPDPIVDTPSAIVTVTGQLLNTLLSTFTAGTWYVMIGLYRSSDGALSPTLYTTVVLTNAPSEVVPVPSGFQSLT